MSLVLIPGWVASLLGKMWRSTALWGIPLRQNLKDHQKSKAHVCHPLPLVPRTLPPGSPQVLSNSGLALTSHLYARDWEASLGNVGATVQAQPFTGHSSEKDEWTPEEHPWVPNASATLLQVLCTNFLSLKMNHPWHLPHCVATLMPHSKASTFQV